MDIQIYLLGFLTTLYFILPAYFSNGGALAFGGGTPVDFGKSDSKGNRWIGDGVTWRGLIAGTLIGILTGAVQGYFGPAIMAEIGQYIFLLGFGALLGDAIGSFLKRRLGISRGQRAPILDQLDFIIVALILVSPVVKMNLPFVIVVLIVTLIIHSLANLIAYLLGIKDVWY